MKIIYTHIYIYNQKIYLHYKILHICYSTDGETR